MNAEKSLKLARRFIELPVEKRRAFLDGLRAENIDFSVFPIPAGVEAPDRQALSYAQQRMWFLWQLDPQSGAYNLPGAVRLTGALDVPALEQAFASLVARHETLRTVFKRHADDRLEQVPLSQPLSVEQQDLSPLPDGEREQAVIAQAQQQSLLPFDLGNGPLLRVKLLKLAQGEHVLLLTLHHIVSDGWSMNVLIDEFTRCYDAHARGEQPQLPDLPIQYSDYALWQRRWLEAGEQARQLQYWQSRLGDEHDVIELPTDHARPPMPSYRGTRHAFSIDPQLAEQLRTLARTHQVTLFMLLLGAFNILLHRYTGQGDLRIGVPIANRNRSEIEGLIGFFVNTQVLRTQLNGQTLVSELLRDIKETALGAQAHQDLPFEQLVEALRLERSISHNPLFQVMYNHQPQVADVSTLKTASGLTLGAVDWQSRTTQFDLTLDTWEKGGRLLAAFTYANDLFEAPTIARMAGHFTALLQALVNEGDLRIGELPMLDAAEQHVLVHDWNASAERYPTGVCIHELIHAQALRTPDATALVFGSQQLSYAQLDGRANQLAHLLRDQGVGPDVLVGICAHRSLEMVVGLLAILKAGGAYVPLDPEYPRERLAYMIEDSGIGLLLTQSALLATLPVDDVNTLVLDQEAEWLDGYSERCPLQTSDSRNLAYVIYTSGSTGRPKGAGNSHAALVNRLCWMQQAYAIDGSDAVLQKTPFSFDVSVWEFFWPLMTGARLVVAAPGIHREPAQLIRTIVDHGISTLHFVPSMLQAFIHERGVEACSSLKRIVCSGEALPLDAQVQVFAKLPQTGLYNLYGPTEAAIDVTHWTCIDEGADQVPIGRPIGNLRTLVLDAQLQPVPAGVAGELYLGGVGLARSYHRRPGLTAERFVPCPFHDGERLYRTGDRVRQRHDGVIEYLGRFDHQVKLRGLRIELGEIETRLMQHAQVREAVVLVPNGKQLVAWLVLSVPQAADDLQAELKAWLLQALPEFMVPSAFVTLDKLPVTANGKLDRKALPLPQASSRQAFIAPVSALEKALATIWGDVLGVEQVGLDDNFFELGGDSIISIQVVSRARQAGIGLNPRDLFQYQSVRSLAAVARAVTEHSSSEQGAVTGTTPLLPIHQVFFDSEIPERQQWNQSVLLKPAQALDAEVLEQALNALVAHHDALRLGSAQHNGQWTARLRDYATQPLLWRSEINDLGQLDALGEEAQRSLNLQEGPLLRAVLVSLPSGEQRLLLVIHHLAVDGVSWRILFEDLQAAYQQRAQGQDIALPLKTHSIKAWAERLQGWAKAPERAAEVAGWQQRLQGAEVALPCANPQGAQLNRHALKVHSRLNKSLTAQLLHSAPAAYRTQVNDLLLTALARVVARWSGQDSVLVQLEGHGREALFDELDLSRTVGWFTSLFPVRLTPAASLDASIKTIKEQLRAIPEKGIGFGALRYLGDADSRAALAALPQPRITFNYLGQFDASFAEDALFAPAREPAGREQSLDAPLGNWLSLDGQVYNGELSVAWTFSREVFTEDAVQALADAFSAELAQLIEHCVSVPKAAATPSDFALSGLDQTQLDALPIDAARIEDIYPLSPMQQGMLFHTLFDQGSGDYVNQLCIDVEGLDPERFRQAWQASVDVHPVLRSAFLWQGKQPLQVVLKQATLEFTLHDWRDHADLTDALKTLAAADYRRGFDLAEAPLLRLQLVRIGDERHHLIYTSHHILMDGWSNSRLLGEVLQRYNGQHVAASAGCYRDYIGWLQRQDGARDEAFWRGQLAELQEPTRLAQGEAQAETGYGDQVQRLNSTQTGRLNQFARQQKVTLNTVVQAAWLLLLQRYTGQATVAFGATVAGRPAELVGVEEQIGLFINTLPVIASPRVELSVGAWLQTVQALNLSLREHEHTPLFDIQRWAGHGGEALFDSILVFENYPVSEVLQRGAPQGLRFGEIENVEQTHYPLTLTVNLGEVLDLQFSYAHGHFTADAIARMAGHLENLLLAMADGAERRLGELDLLGAVERRQLVDDWSTALMPPPASRAATEHVSAHQLFEVQAARQPKAPALLFGDTVLSYSQLNARANQLARHLRDLGVGPDVLVGIAVERGLDMIIGLLAVLKAGGGYVPLDPEYPQDRLQCMIEDSGTQLLLTHGHLVERLAIPAGVAHLSLDQHAAWSGLSADNLPNQTDPQNLAYVMFTSGSTGRPKGVGISQLALTRHAYVSLQFFNMNGSDRVLQFSTFNFDGFVEQLYPALICGASVVLRGTDIWDSETFYRQLIDKQISVVDLTTAYWNLLARDFAAAGPRDYGRLKQVHAGGEAMPPEGLATWSQAGLGHVRLLNTYGPTEATVTVTALDCTDYVTGAKPTPSTMPIGSVLAGRSIYLLDDSGSPAPVGVVGELVIGGELLARGYFNRPGLSAERFLPDPFSSSGGRLYRTGDLARYNADGVIEYVGRIDHQVKIRGFRIELGEIEARLAEQDVVRDTLVIAQPANNGLQLVAYVVPTQTGLATAGAEQQAELREHIKAQLRENLPDYMIPAYILFLEKMPLSPNGKIDRKALPKADASQLQHGYIAPCTELEKQLAAIWQDVLELDQVGLNDHFFELGGHSLLATQAVARIKPLLACELTLRDLFAAPTLSAFSAVLAARMAEGVPRKAVPKLLAAGPRSAASLSLVQRRLWVVEQLSSASGAYGMPLAVRLKGELQVPLLVRALNEVVRRHEVLRTAYVSDEEGDPLALISAELTVDLPLEDLCALDRAEQDRRVSEAVENNARQPISLLQAPLLRGRVLRLAADEHVLLYAMHHIISDGWSMSVLVNETVEIYARLQADDATPLVPLPVQYADYAHWQLELQAAGILREQADYWREALAGHDGLLRLPTDFARPQTPSQAGEDFSFALDPTLYQQLKTLSRKAGITLYSTLLGSFQLLLHRVTGSDDVLVGADVAGRSQPELEGLIGFFVNILPLRSRFAASQSLDDYLNAAQQTLINGFEQQDLPFDMINEAAGVPRHKGHNPLVQALFVMNNLPLQSASIDGLDVEVLHTRGGYSKFDMALFIDEEADRLLGTWQFATDLFSRERIAGWVKDWTAILERIVAAIDDRATITLGEINVSTPQAVSQPAASAAPAGKADKLGKFLKKAQGAGTARPAVALMRETPLVPGQVFPLLMEPTDPGLDLVEWVKANRPLIEQKLSHHAGILFRGFNLRDIHGFEAFAEAVQPGLYGQYGDLPKKEGGKNTYRSTPYPEKKMILFHNESSHQDRWPRKQMFYCEQPSPIGGATPVVDCRLMYQRLPAELQQRFESKGLLYVRTFADKLDVSWHHFFKTDVRAEVEARCQLAGIQWTWLDNDELQIRTPCPAVIRHPLTGEKSFFNQVQLHHIYCLDPDVRDDLLALFGETRMPRHVYYGDGTPIEDEVMQLIGDLYEACAVRFDWQKGDVILLDNMLAAHARDPFEGPRKIVVAMGEMIERSQLDAPSAALHTTTDKETAGA